MSNGAETFAFSQEDAEPILFQSTNSLENHPLAVEEIKSKLIHLKKKEICLQLHGNTLSEYWCNKRIPQGLRIQKAPTIGKKSKDFVKKWCEILNKCSMDLKLLITEEVTNQKGDALSDIENHEALMRDKLGDNFTQIHDSIKQTLKTFEEGLMTTKIWKYKKNSTDYQQDRVYNFQCDKDAQLLSERYQTDHHSDTTTADSDLPSDSDSSWGDNTSQKTANEAEAEEGETGKEEIWTPATDPTPASRRKPSD